MEEWRPVIYKSYHLTYEVSNLGRIRRAGNKRVLKPALNSKGYYRVRLSNYPGYKFVLVHRTVAFSFVPNPDNQPQVNHIDENKTNNVASNLEWVDNKTNVRSWYKNNKVAPVTEEHKRNLSIARKKAWDEGKYASRKPRSKASDGNT